MRWLRLSLWHSRSRWRSVRRGERTPWAELIPASSRRLHLRAPTVTHHLSELRLAGLVNLTVRGQEKFYSARREALRAACSNLDEFLDS